MRKKNNTNIMVKVRLSLGKEKLKLKKRNNTFKVIKSSVLKLLYMNRRESTISQLELYMLATITPRINGINWKNKYMN